jgi:FeS assembly SUF system protein
MFNGIKKNLASMFGSKGGGDATDETQQPSETLPAEPEPSSDEKILGDAEIEEVKQGIVKVLKTVYDPEIPINIYDLGLIYGISVDQDGTAIVEMTLTSPNCPMADMILQEVYYKSTNVPGVTGGKVDLVWDPPWDPSSMSDAAKLELNML